MIKPCFIAAFLLFSINLAAKEKEELKLAVIHKDSIIGYTINKNPVRASHYQFSKDIFMLGLNADQDRAMLVLKDLSQKNGIYGEGDLSVFNFQTGDFDWHFSIKGENIRRSKDAIFYKYGTSSSLFSMADGSRIRKVPSPYIFIDYNSNIAFGGEYGVDLITGKCIWRHPIPRRDDEPVGELYHIDDSLVAFCYGGIHVLNLYNGQGWDYTLSTTKANLAVTESELGMAGLGLITGIITGVAVMPGESRPRRVTGFNSNIVYDNGLIYMADKVGLLCWNIKTGKRLWERKISRSKMSGSELFIRNGSVYIVNKGIASQGTVGSPFIAAYDKTSGDEIFFETLGTGGITSYKLDDDICWIYNGGLYQVDLTANKVSELTFSVNRYVTANRSFTDASNIFIENEKMAMISIEKIFPDCFYMITEDHELCVFNKNAELKQMLKPDTYWVQNGQYKDCHMLRKAKGDIALERDGKKLFSLPAAFDTEIVGDRLYRIVPKGLQVISLPELVMN